MSTRRPWPAADVKGRSSDVQYMCRQLDGREADVRSDLWALGCVPTKCDGHRAMKVRGGSRSLDHEGRAAPDCRLGAAR